MLSRHRGCGGLRRRRGFGSRSGPRRRCGFGSRSGLSGRSGLWRRHRLGRRRGSGHSGGGVRLRGCWPGGCWHHDGTRWLRIRHHRRAFRAGRHQQQDGQENNESTGQLTTPSRRLARPQLSVVSASDRGNYLFSAHHLSSLASVSARSNSGSARFSSKRNLSAAPTSGPGPMP